MSPDVAEGARPAERQLVCSVLTTDASPNNAIEMPRVAGNDLVPSSS